jgi:hypothetical protein
MFLYFTGSCLFVVKHELLVFLRIRSVASHFKGTYSDAFSLLRTIQFHFGLISSNGVCFCLILSHGWFTSLSFSQTLAALKNRKRFRKRAYIEWNGSLRNLITRTTGS